MTVSTPSARLPATRWDAWRVYLRLGAAQALFFRANLVASIVGAVLTTVLFVTVWRSVFAGRAQVNGITEQRAVAYAIMASLLSQLAFQRSTLPERVRSGAVATDVARPLDVVSQNLAMTLGRITGSLPAAVTTIVVGVAMGGFEGPRDVVAAAGFIVSALLGLFIATVMLQTVAMVSFWTTDTRGPNYIYGAIANLSSGALVPLWFMPSAVAAVLGWLPWPSQIFVPLQIWFGDVQGWAVVTALALQVFWLAVTVGLLLFVNRRAMHVVVVNGG